MKEGVKVGDFHMTSFVNNIIINITVLELGLLEFNSILTIVIDDIQNLKSHPGFIRRAKEHFWFSNCKCN